MPANASGADPVGAAGSDVVGTAGDGGSAGGENLAGAASGAAGGDANGGTAARGGSSSAGTGGAGGFVSSGGQGAGGNSGLGPKASAGCALASPTIGLLSGTAGSFTPYLPAGYDGVTPVPLLVVFHATSGYNDYSNLTRDKANAERFLIAAARAAGSVNTFESIPKEQVTELFNQLLASACVDMNRLFAVGNGSGARFAMNWLSGGKNYPVVPPFRAAALVGTYQRMPTPAPLPLLFLHNVFSVNSRNVAQDADGLKGLAMLMTANQCSGDSSTPFATAGCESGGVDPGCVDYQECAAPLRFCHHNDADSVGDPWPCFGASAIYEFFEPYRGY